MFAGRTQRALRDMTGSPIGPPVTTIARRRMTGSSGGPLLR
jgi:hypothetical protein